MSTATYNGVLYEPVVPPCADSEELAKLGARLVLYHDKRQTKIRYVNPGMLAAGWVIGRVIDVTWMETPHCFLVLTFGSWGRGKNLKQAAQNCKEAGGRAGDRAVVRLVLNDEKSEVNSSGSIVMESGSEILNIGGGFKLGALLRLCT